MKNKQLDLGTTAQNAIANRQFFNPTANISSQRAPPMGATVAGTSNENVIAAETAMRNEMFGTSKGPLHLGIRAPQGSQVSNERYGQIVYSFK